MPDAVKKAFWMVQRTLDGSNHRRRKVADGTVTTFAGSGTRRYRDGAGTTAMFNHPVGIALDKEDNLLVGDTSNHRIRTVPPAGDVKTLAREIFFTRSVQVGG